VGNVSSFWIEAVPAFTWIIYLRVGLPVLIFAFIGVWATIIRVRPRAEVVPEWAVLVGLGVATFILHCVVPSGLGDRFMVRAMPSIVLFSAAGVDGIARRFGDRLPIGIGIVRVGLAAALIAAFCADSFTVPLQLRSGGYEALVQDVGGPGLERPAGLADILRPSR
jgi:hypothetical protein